ncbi:YjfB family protein [Metabacillus sp. B2-18]|uniref:YjfB family protein n=1 Tax=Metabacillus sp. B2-18 TaxID=2897333 RepID=UPI001E479478|nr:YjfB family protein [Metabacillus sp. B2-18]UGB30410.1 YjfB family protein [Metabacillus sp. B2-18]
MEVSFSLSKAQASLGQKVSLALAKKTLDNVEQKGQQTVEMLKASHPTLGKSIDIKA